MLKSILKLQRVSPISVGLGGPFSGLLHALTGIHKILPFWALCPLWCLFFAPLILLFPIIVPIYAISILQMMYRKRDIYSYLPAEELSDTPSISNQKFEDQRFRNIYLENAPSLQLGTLQDPNAEQVLAHSMSTNDSEYRKSKSQDHKDNTPNEPVEDNQKVYLHNVVGLIQISIKSNLFHHKHLLVFAQLIYWILIALISYGIAYFAFLAFQEYHFVASQHRSLQIATPEQLAYADQIVTIFTTGGMLIWASMLYFIALTLCISIGCIKPGTVARKILTKNFLPLAVVSCFLCSLGILTERYYAHYVLIAYEDIILGREFFNPAYLFIGIRCLIVYVFVMGLSLSMLMSLRLLPLSFKSSSDDKPEDHNNQTDKSKVKVSEPKGHTKDLKKQESSRNCCTSTYSTHHTLNVESTCEMLSNRNNLPLELNTNNSYMCLT